MKTKEEQLTELNKEINDLARWISTAAWCVGSDDMTNEKYIEDQIKKLDNLKAKREILKSE